MLTVIANFLEPFSYLLYLIGVLIHYRYSGWRSQQWLFLYYLLATLLMAYASYIVEVGTNNIWVYNATAFAGAVCIGSYFYQLLQSRLKKVVVLSLIGLYVVYAIVKNIALKEIHLFDSIGYSLVSASVAIYVLMYFHQLLTHITETNIFCEFNFWLASGYLIYFAGSFIIFLSYYYFTQKILNTYTDEERELLTALWGVHNVLLFISALSLLLGSLWLTYRKKSASS